MEHWERPRHPDGKFKKVVKDAIEQTPPPLTPAKVSLRELDAEKVFAEKMQEAGAVTRFTNLADAVAQMQDEHFENQQLIERLRGVIEIDLERQRELRTRIAVLIEEKAQLVRELEEARSAQSIRARAIRQLTAENDKLKQERETRNEQEGLPSRLRKATEELERLKWNLTNDVRMIDRVLNPEG
jgi:uncharacterized coiled-coil DUF342 family protein